jgi:polar amino acid transport system substrate-binding protein
MTKLLSLLITFFFLNCFPVYAAEWDDIIERGKFIIGVKNNVRPLSFPDSQGNLQGFEIDIAKRLAKELLGDENLIIFVPVSNIQRLQLVIDDQVDMAIASVTINSSRQHIVDFSPYYYFDSTGIIVKKTHLSSINNSEKTKIAVLENSSTIDVIKENLPQVTLKGVKSYQEAFSSVENGIVDGFAGDLTILTGWMQEYPEYQILTQTWSGYPLGIVLPKGLQYQELRQKVSEAIARWKKEGWLEERAKFWGL